MLGMIMMEVGMMAEGITSDGHEKLVGVMAIRCFMSEELGRWKWNHDTLASAMFTENCEIFEEYHL